MIEAADVLDVIALAHAHLDLGWCQDALSIGKGGRKNQPYVLDAQKWCAVGAVRVACYLLASKRLPEAELFSAAMPLLRAEAQRMGETPVSFNNAEERKAEEVKALFEQAAQKVGKG